MQRNLLPSSVSSDPLNRPSGLVFPMPAISLRNGVKDFRLRFVAAFVPLCSVSSPLHVALSYHTKKISCLFSNSLFNLHSIVFPGLTDKFFFNFSYCVPSYLRAKLHSCEIDFGLDGNVVIKLIAKVNSVFRHRN